MSADESLVWESPDGLFTSALRDDGVGPLTWSSRRLPSEDAAAVARPGSHAEEGYAFLSARVPSQREAVERLDELADALRRSLAEPDLFDWSA